MQLRFRIAGFPGQQEVKVRILLQVCMQLGSFVQGSCHPRAQPESDIAGAAFGPSGAMCCWDEPFEHTTEAF